MWNIATLCRSIIQKLYDKYIMQNDDELAKAERDVQAYADTIKENITALVANALSSLALSDATVTIEGENKRSEYLNEVIQKEWKNAKANIANGLGSGMTVSIPYCTDNGLGRRIYIDTVPKNCFFITNMQGDEVTECTALSDYKVYKNTVRFMRWTDYSVKNGIYTIRQRATKDGSPVALENTPWWGDIAQEISISNVERLPIGIFKCPTSNRRPKNIDGVPITYGCESTLLKIANTFEAIEREYDLKQPFVGVSRDMFGKDDKLPKNGLFKLFDTDTSRNGNMFDIYSPEIQQSAYYAKLQEHFAFLEKQIGCSRGILTDMTTNGATATEIKRSMYQTFALCDDIHRNFTKYYDDLIYGIDVLCNFYNLTPQGDYSVKYDWSYSLLEDSQSTFNQLETAHSLGAVAAYEIRQFVKPDETAEEAKEKVREIAEETKTDSIEDILGGLEAKEDDTAGEARQDTRHTDKKDRRSEQGNA